MKLFEGKTVLVTGSTRGIGNAVALAFAREGAKVVLTGTSAVKATEAAQAVSSATGAEVLGIELKVDSAADCSSAVEKTLKAFGSVDILVNNAGITRDNLLIRMKEEDYDAVLNTNLKGAFLMAKAVARPMMKQRSGRIINITSVVGQTGQAGQANYSASKAGLIGLTKSLARELAPRGILVNAVAPGFVRTAMTDALSEDVKKEISGMIPLGGPCEPEAIADAVIFLSGPGSSYITGQVLAVNGGMYM